MAEVNRTKRVPVGVVGVGSLGQWHTRIYSEIPDAELVGVYDTNAARAAEIAARYHTRVFPSIAAMAGTLRRARVGALAIEADRTIMLERETFLRRADRGGICVVAVDAQESEVGTRNANERT